MHVRGAERGEAQLHWALFGRTFSTILLSVCGELYSTAADIGSVMYNDNLNASKMPLAMLAGNVCAQK